MNGQTQVEHNSVKTTMDQAKLEQLIITFKADPALDSKEKRETIEQLIKINKMALNGLANPASVKQAISVSSFHKAIWRWSAAQRFLLESAWQLVEREDDDGDVRP